jgi:hypothetical protein
MTDLITDMRRELEQIARDLADVIAALERWDDREPLFRRTLHTNLRAIRDRARDAAK